MKVHPDSRAARSAWSACSSPRPRHIVPPMPQAPKPITETLNPVLPSCRCSMWPVSCSGLCQDGVPRLDASADVILHCPRQNGNGAERQIIEPTVRLRSYIRGSTSCPRKGEGESRCEGPIILIGLQQSSSLQLV